MKKYYKTGVRRQVGVLFLGLLILLSSLFVMLISTYAAEKNKAIAFKTQEGGTYDGMPLFDGEPCHLDAYLNTLLDYVGIEGTVRYAIAQREDMTLLTGEHVGKTIPGAEQFGDHVQGVSTDFPSMISMGQTWNKDLMESIGQVIGDENLYTTDYLDSISNFNAIICTALQDLRINPLSGRFDESISEDPNLTGTLVDKMARGASGIDIPGNEDSFWTKGIVTTKHFTNYAAQWFRLQSDVSATQRAIMEYHAKTPVKGFKSGAIGGFMTSYGRTNGIPNSLSPLIAYMQTLSPWGKEGGILTLPDMFSDTSLGVVDMFGNGAMGNGYDMSYSPSFNEAMALMLVAFTGSESCNYSTNSYIQAVLDDLKNGTYGLTIEDVRKTAKTILIPLIRCGVFNERDKGGYPVKYPFTELSAKSLTPIDATVLEHQQIALQSAQEGIVLLKNDNNVLPLDKDSKVTVVGPFANAHFKTTYAVSKTPDLPNTGLTSKDGISKFVTSPGGISYSTDGNDVVFKSVNNGKYISMTDTSTGAIAANADTIDEAAKFEAYAWGQSDGYSYLSLDNSKWLNVELTGGNWLSAGIPTDIKVNGKEILQSDSAALPARIRRQMNDDGTVSFIVNSYSNSYFSGQSDYYIAGHYLNVDENGHIGFSDVLGNKENAKQLNTSNTKFAIETVKKTGSDALTYKEVNGNEYAIVVVGAPTRHSSGEGNDRSDLYLGDDQYELINNVSNEYPGNTIVVINASYPVIAKEIQNSPKVAAILYQPYGGQYDGYALGQVIYGDYAPTGKLTSTWYADMRALPVMDEYSIPEGPDTIYSLDKIDPRYVTDMSTGDPITSKLTYMYTDAEVTYAFGYGITYSDFQYHNLSVNYAHGVYNVKVNVSNTGSVNTSEVVQLYIANDGSAYGAYAPKKKLAAFEKVYIPAGQTRTVTLSFDKNDIALWDTNSEKYIVEAGTYQFQIGRSSNDIRQTAEVSVRGENIAKLDASTEPVSVFDHTFASSGVIYREASKQNTVTGLQQDKLTNGYSVVMSKRSGAWVALKNVDMTNSTGIKLKVASTENDSKIYVKEGSPAGRTLATLSFGSTTPINYIIANTTSAGGIVVNELGYIEVAANLNMAVNGVTDLFLVFGNPDIRVDSLQLSGVVPGN